MKFKTIFIIVVAILCNLSVSTYVHAQKTELNVAIVYSNSFGSSYPGQEIETVEQLINDANIAYERSEIDLVLVPVIIAPLKVHYEDGELNGDTHLMHDNTKNDALDLADLNNPNTLINFSIGEYGDGVVHQTILVVGGSTTEKTCGVTNNDGYSVVRSPCYDLNTGQVGDTLTLAHEVAHNLGANHDYGIRLRPEEHDCIIY